MVGKENFAASTSQKILLTTFFLFIKLFVFLCSYLSAYFDDSQRTPNNACIARKQDAEAAYLALKRCNYNTTKMVIVQLISYELNTNTILASEIHNDEYAGTGSFIVGTSTANQRIESFWSQFSKDRPSWWRKNLDKFAIRWNQHLLAPSKGATAPRGRPDTLYFVPELYGCESFKKTLDLNELEEFSQLSVPDHDNEPEFIEFAKQFFQWKDQIQSGKFSSLWKKSVSHLAKKSNQSGNSFATQHNLHNLIIAIHGEKDYFSWLHKRFMVCNKHFRIPNILNHEKICHTLKVLKDNITSTSSQSFSSFQGEMSLDIKTTAFLFSICLPLVKAGIYVQGDELPNGNITKYLKGKTEVSCLLECERSEQCDTILFKQKNKQTRSGYCWFVKKKNTTDVKKKMDNSSAKIFKKLPSTCAAGPPCKYKQCVDIYASKGYRCKYKDDWILLQQNVCFGARANEFGTFTIQHEAVMTGMKLVHVGGVGLQCVDTTPTKWGCNSTFHLGYKMENVMTLVTDVENKIIYPNIKYHIEKYGYLLPGYNANSPYLIFNSRNYTLHQGQELRIQYGETLYITPLYNNKGVSCADIYAKFADT
ncbi:uncharacterized protein LOC130622416 [Hydractinia symbiolongicarpus]|uniref:uncharacterized protein LOC130622416 n=1 Tax=Hydractinia symbiolongicarpus TaxID=13093 RepID=UPI00254E8868|nr:uncharacterized protein LOC130622416 [Hydractinia symbiolongicarpus]